MKAFKSRVSRIIGIAMCAIIACIAFVGCTQNSRGIILTFDDNESGNKNVNISFFGYKADSHDLVPFEKAMNAFMNNNPGVTVSYEGINGDKYWDALDKRIANHDFDDVIMVRHETVLRLGSAGMLADLSGLKTTSQYAEFMSKQFTADNGAVYFLPTAISSFGLYVNYDLLKVHGQSVPTKLSEFTAVCDYFVRRGITPIIANNDTSFRTVIVGRSMFDVYQSQNPSNEIAKFNTNPHLLVEKLRSGFELVGAMIGKKWIDTAEVLDTVGTKDDLDLFVAGNRPFMLIGSWESPRVAAKKPKFNYGVHPYPIMDDGSVMVVDANMCISVNAASARAEQSKKLVEHLTSPDTMWGICDGQSGYMPIVGERTPSDAAIKPSSEYIVKNRNVIGSDYKLTLPLDAKLLECTLEVLQGVTIADALDDLDTLLKERQV